MLSMYRRRDCLDKFEFLPMPIPNVWTGIGVIDLEYQELVEPEYGQR